MSERDSPNKTLMSSKKRKHLESNRLEEQEVAEDEDHEEDDDFDVDIDEEEDDAASDEEQFCSRNAENRSDGDDHSDGGTERSDDSDDYFNYDGYTSNDYDEDCSQKELNQEIEMLEMSGIFSKLPTEIFFEILSRLPIKSLSVCKWVSKAWFSAIKHPRFTEIHYKKILIQNKSSFCVPSSWLDEKIFSLNNHENLEAYENLDTPKLPRPLREMDSCNGLVFSRRQPYFICNPITGEHMVVPKPPMSKRDDIVTGFGFDPVSEVFKVIRVMNDKVRNGETITQVYSDPVFEHNSDPVSEVFKVIRVMDDKVKNGETIAQVYSFGTGKWRLIPKVPYHFDSTKSNVFVNGALHWMGFPYYKSTTSQIIISFKLDIEEFQEVPLPPPSPPPRLRFSEFEQSLCTLDECLCIVRTFRDNHIEIWMMKQYGLQSSWAHRNTIKNIRVEGDHERGPYKSLQLMKNGNLLMLCSHHDPDYYNRCENYLYCIYIGTGIYCDSVLQPLLHLHVGSLISPRSVGKLRKSKRLYGRKFW